MCPPEPLGDGGEGRVRHRPVFELSECIDEEINKCDAREGRTPRRLLGMAIMYNFKPGPTHASITDGKVINIEDCQSYSIDARVSEDGKTLRVRHWTGFGRTWTLVR